MNINEHLIMSEHLAETKDNRYNNSKTYKIISGIDQYFYIGSTCTQLCKRLYVHKLRARLKQKSNLYQHFNKIGINHMNISLIEEQCLDNKEQLRREEDMVIQYNFSNEFCLNMRRAFTTEEEKK